MNKKVQLQDLGVMDYKEAWDYQEQLFQQTVDIKIANRREGTAAETPNYLLYVAHPHVYTLGKSGDFANLLVTKSSLPKKALPIIR